MRATLAQSMKDIYQMSLRELRDLRAHRD